MKRYFLTLILAAACTAAHAQDLAAVDTIKVSDLFLTHIVFDTDVIYAQLSSTENVTAKIVPESRETIAIKAKGPFSIPLSISAKESNGTLHTCIVAYEEYPQIAIYDRTKANLQGSRVAQAHGSVSPAFQSEGMEVTTDKARVVSEKDKKRSARKGDAPLLKDVITAPQALYHISNRAYGIEATCVNILSYSDITYLVFRIDNKSGVSYACANVSFKIESRKARKNTAQYDDPIFPKSRQGTINCAPGNSSTVGFTFDKMSLNKDQILKVYFYEDGGQRELTLSIRHVDINKAANSL